MKYSKRRYFTRSDKTLMWNRWSDRNILEELGKNQGRYAR